MHLHLPPLVNACSLHILTYDVLLMYFCDGCLLSQSLTRELFGTMKDRQAFTRSSFQGPKNFIGSCSFSKTCIQIASEGTRLTINAFHIVFILSYLRLAFVDHVHAKLTEKPVGQQQASTIGCSIVCQANFHTIFWQFMSTCYIPSIPAYAIWQIMSVLVSWTTILYLGVLYLFLSWITSCFQAQ